MVAFLGRNLCAFADRGLKLPLDADAGRIRVSEGRDAPSVMVSPSPGRQVRLHSDRDPLREAQRQLAEAWPGREPSLAILIGVGLGYLLDAIETRAPEARILVLEPLPGTLPHLLARRDWHDRIASGHLTILAGPDYAGAADAWRLVDPESDPPPVIVHPVIKRECPAETAAALQVAAQIQFGALANLEARKKFAGPYLLNTLRNLSTIAAESDAAALAGEWADTPAIVVGAGPSLDRNLVELARAGERALIIAVDTALRPLLGAGIAPHVVVAVDPSEINATHLQHLWHTDRTWLVAEGSMPPSVFASFRGRGFTFKVSDHQPWPWYERHGLIRGRIQAWGSVLTSAFDLALHMGCDPIIFTGADLAFSDGRPYCRGTTYEMAWAGSAARGIGLPEVWRKATSRGAIEALDLHGDPVLTTANLRAFQTWIVERMRVHPDRRFINATGGGILAGPPIEQFALDDALRSSSPIPDSHLRGRLAAAWQRGATNDAAGRVQAADEDLREHGGALLAGWRTFALGTVSDESLLSAVHEGIHRSPDRPDARAASDGDVLTPDAGSALRIPECLAILRAVLRREPWPDWVGVEEADPQAFATRSSAMPRYLNEALRRLADLLARRHEWKTGFPPPARIPPGPVPALGQYRWPAAIASAVTAFEARIGHVLGLAKPPLLTSPGGVFLHDYTRTVQGPPLSHEAVPDWRSSGERSTDAATLSLAREWIMAVSACMISPPDEQLAAVAPGDRMAALFLDAISRWHRPAPLPVGTTVEVAITPDGPGCAASPTSVLPHLHVRPETLQRVATGLLVRRIDGPALGATPAFLPPPFDVSIGTVRGHEPAGRLHVAVRSAARPIGAAGDAHALGFCDPIVLSGQGLPPCVNPIAVDGDRVLIAGRFKRESWHIDAVGRVTPATTWPGPILGELSLGPGGGAVAWDSGKRNPAKYSAPCLWVREHEDSPAGRIPLPFRPTRGIALPNGRFAWVCREGGIGVWAPSEAIRVHFAGHAFLGLIAAPGGLVAYPVRFASKALTSRRMPSHAWFWDTAADQLETGPAMTTAGPVSCRRMRGGWTADCHPIAGIVRLTRADGATCDLTCPEPLAADWAGTSLVVTCPAGDVLLFRRLREMIDGCVDANETPASDSRA